MTDRVAELMRGIDSPRAIPAAASARVAATLEVTVPALPARLRERLAGALTSVADGPLQDVDAPRPLPPALRSSLEFALIQMPERRAWWRPAAIAAVVLLLASTVAISAGRGPADRGLERADSGSVAEGGAPAPSPFDTVVPSTDEPRSGTTASGGVDAATGGPSGPDASQSGATAGGAVGPAPPYAFQFSSAASTADQGTTQPASPPPELPLLRVGVVGGDVDAEAGFRAYVAILNREGGAGGHRLELVDARTVGTIVTVNLSSDALTAAPLGRPVLEGLVAPEAILRDDVFSFASPVSRQARLAAAEAFPEPAPGAKAVLVTPPDGVLAGEAADAARAVLQARAVTVVTVVYEPHDQPVLVPADAAILLLDRLSTGAWLEMARSMAFAPTRGSVGVFGMAGEDLAPLLDARDRALSPYAVPTRESAEGSALRSASGRPISATSLHGWVTAKSLAVALWQSGADDGAELQLALGGLAGYDNGFAPPYEVRPGTNARTPEALVMGSDGDRLVARSGFRRDAHG